MVDDVVVNIDELAEEVVVSIDEELEEIFILVTEPGDRMEIREDWVEPYSYIGKALSESEDTDPVWKIFRIEVAADGTVVAIEKANGVKWTDRLTEIYN